MSTRKRGNANDMEANGSLEPPYASMTDEPDGTKDGVMVAQVEESHIRSLAKGLTWRFVASGTTIIIAKIVTGETTVAFQIGFFEFFAKIGIYYLHERIWAKVKI